MQFDVDFGAGVAVERNAAISPDGQRIAFVASDEGGRVHLATRRLDETDVTLVREFDELLGQPFFSPDSR